MKQDDGIKKQQSGNEGATFIVKVKCNQNATWQGTVTWVEEKVEESFRSTLELIRLMDSALPEEQKKTLKSAKAE